MAKTKSAGSTSLGRDSRPKYLGVKLFDGQDVKKGQIIVRQKGSKYLAGKNARTGKDYTIYSLKDGKIKFTTIKKRNFDGSQKIAKVVNVI